MKKALVTIGFLIVTFAMGEFMGTGFKVRVLDKMD